MGRFYLVPIETVGSYRGPKYFEWRMTDPPGSGIDCRWSLMDYGFLPYCLILAHDITQDDHDALVLHSDVYAFPDDLSGAVDDQDIDVFFEAIQVPTDWLTPSTTWLELLRNMAGLFQFNQKFGGIAAAETGELHSVFDNVTLDDTYNDLTAQEQGWFDATIAYFEQAFGIDVPAVLPNMKLRQLAKAAGDFWEDRPFYMGGAAF